ncbi:sulfatase-like hydrolase/transferase [Reichenbachiella ulvae]|uniref:Sulfatase-like hydrolase/transferase n=1 Tax=Reichenbachiella ulvae TaxID=2980104 RepID=A0ABT3CNY1_9BACT|nr:sulfatase-like hydrolase/transferase [Reichenbachiella ulvae]MCV9385276.1 sulfatase-like hydrolase/transferase [Reichenbachiella ulvae]
MRLNLCRRWGVIVIVVIFFCWGCKSISNQKTETPNVLIILTDDMGYGDISAYNESAVSTPAIDRIGKEGVICTDFYVPTPYCAPSRASLLTGRFPLRHGLIHNPTPDAGIDDIGLSSREITLAELLSDAGYKTQCIGKWHLGHKEEYFPTNHGFDDYYGILYSNDMRPVQMIHNLDTVSYPVNQNNLTRDYTNRALDFLEENKDRPFYLQFNHAMPHKPLAVSEEFYTPESPEDLYQDVINELNWSTDMIMNKLEELGVLDQTIVIFMSDNGPWYGGDAGGLKGMKATTWEGGIRVPFMIRFPERFSSDSRVSVPCSSLDVLPTVLTLTQVEPVKLNTLDGQDITDVLNGKCTEHQPVFSLHDDQIMSIRHEDFKLFVKSPRSTRLPLDWIDPRAPDDSTIIARAEQAGPEDYPGVFPLKPKEDIQLFDLSQDRTESKDLSVDKPGRVVNLLQVYEDYRANFQLPNSK